MSLLKFINSKACKTPPLIIQTPVGGIIIEELHCIKPAGHKGFHRSIKGQFWINREEQQREINQRMEKDKNPKTHIILKAR